MNNLIKNIFINISIIGQQKIYNYYINNYYKNNYGIYKNMINNNINRNKKRVKYVFIPIIVI